MAFQVSGQLVTTKSSRLLHVAGCDGAFVLAAGVAFVVMMSSADASVAQAEHDTSRSRRPGIVVRQAVRAIAPPYCQLSKYDPFKLPSDPCWPLLDASASDLSRRNASRLVLSIGTVDEVGWLDQVAEGRHTARPQRISKQLVADAICAAKQREHRHEGRRI